MKKHSNKLLLMALVIISTIGYIVSCTHKDNKDTPTPPTPINVKHGDAVYLSKPTSKDGDTTKWWFDQIHSNVLWSAGYEEGVGLLTGRFDRFGINDLSAAGVKKIYPMSGTSTAGPVPDTAWAFYEGDPTKTHFAGYVQMNTSNTGQPGRDGGCYLTSVFAPKMDSVKSHNLTDSNVAVIKTVTVENDPNSINYKVTLSMTWLGVTKTEYGTLTYQNRITAPNGAYDIFGLKLDFSFNCRDFGMTSTNIGDVVNVECNMNFNNQ
jgi:polyisoprenoid-binding protein YceI